MRKLISSQSTFFYKIIFTTMWIGMFSLGTLLMWFGVSNGNGELDPEINESKWICLVVTIIGTIIIYWYCMRLKKVEVDEEGFHVSNYLKTITIPVHDLEDVSGSIFIVPELIWLKFKQTTEFGYKIVFIPPLRLFGGFNEHPLVSQLKTLIQDADQKRVESEDSL